MAKDIVNFGEGMFDLIAEAKQLIAINSESRVGTREIADHLTPIMQSVGLKTLPQPDPKHAAQVNLVGLSHNGKLPPHLSLNTHLDTVDAGDPHLWTKTGGNPFGACVEGDTIYGLGSADTKLSILCQLQAASRVNPDSLKRPLAIVGTYGEEIGLLGARQLMKSQGWSPSYTIVSEPSDLEIVYTHKGHLVLEWSIQWAGLFIPADEQARFYECTFPGKAVHSATPALGINPIDRCFEWLKQGSRCGLFASLEGGTVFNRIPSQARALIMSEAPPERLQKETGAQCRLSEKRAAAVAGPEVAAILIKIYNHINQLNEEWKSKELPPFSPPTTTAAITVAHIGEEGASFVISIRYLPGEDVSGMLNATRQCNGEIEASYRGVSLSLQIVRNNASFYTDPESLLVSKSRDVLQKLGLPGNLLAKPACTEASLYAEEGCEVIVVGPGKAAGNAHCPNEHNSIKQLRTAVDYYEQMIRLFCS